MFKFIPGAAGTITSLISSVSTLLPVSSELADILDAALGDGDWSYLAIKNGSDIEIVKITSITGLVAVIERNIDASGAKAFPAGSTVCYYTAYSAIADIIDTVGVPSDLEFVGEGDAQVSEEDDVVTINVPTPTIGAVPSGGVDILGAWPNIQIALTNPTGCCDDTSTAASPLSIVGVGLALVEAVDPVTYQITVETPNFVGEGGISVSGTWPDITFGFGGGVGTVTSVAVGTGLTLSGSPTVSPTISLTATGVVAGTYGDVIINAQGQFTFVAVGFNPVSAIGVTAATGLSVNRVGSTVTLAGVDAEEGVKGVLAIADVDGPLDPGNETEAVTPALLSAVLDDIQFTEIEGGQTYNGDPDGNYTNIVATSVVSIDIPLGGKALVIVSVNVKNNADILDIPEYGLALFNTTPVRLFASPAIKQCQQVLHALIEGPAAYTLAVATTDITGYTLNSNSIQVIII